MARIRVPNQKKEYSEHYQRIERYTTAIDSIFKEASLELSQIVAISGFDGSKPFSFSDYPKTKSKLDKFKEKLSSDISFIISTGISSEWSLCNQKNDALVQYFLKDKDARSVSKFSKYFNYNESALKAFKIRKDGKGLTLSSRVWNVTEQFVSETESLLSSGIFEGASADSIGLELTKYLKDPDKYYRRVKGQNDTLKLSKPAEAFHPGNGVYRSSYKNALRLSRTEINMAYRLSDYSRWNQLDFVVGFEVKRSGKHYPCKLCEALAGKYPKTFKFVGWHPNCRCYVIPILMTADEFWSGSKSSMNEVEDVPTGMKEWATANTERSKKAKTIPYWIKYNFVRGRLDKGLKKSVVNQSY